MGDSGSATQGYLVAVAIGLGALADLALWATAFICVASFSLDATLTLLRRTRAGERLSEPHRGHIYQHPSRALGSHARLLAVWHIWSFAVLLPPTWAAATGVLHPAVASALSYGITMRSRWRSTGICRADQPPLPGGGYSLFLAEMRCTTALEHNMRNAKRVGADISGDRVSLCSLYAAKASYWKDRQ